MRSLAVGVLCFLGGVWGDGSRTETGVESNPADVRITNILGSRRLFGGGDGSHSQRRVAVQQVDEAIQLVRPLIQTSAKRVIEEARPSFVVVQEDEDDLAGPAVYSYAWQVSNADEALYSNQEESRDGDNVRGQYVVLDADGVLRTVRYTVIGEEGFKAEILREAGVGPVQEGRTRHAATRSFASQGSHDSQASRSGFGLASLVQSAVASPARTVVIHTREETSNDASSASYGRAQIAASTQSASSSSNDLGSGSFIRTDNYAIQL
ncbi:unnamed protein product [Darwinula stevensoni]|uniref:Uncharacterized protein n=1 Tax=Darwinula stevensoni TaxID=69355 RepID=A0A7R8ZY07_9CRUS|nr:unnamed protein product [Darwinula stevensoni]CAG0879481.1 unnamed protein product [Darwinula stevensoni]